MTLLILGAAGKTGRTVVEEAIKLGHKVHVLTSDLTSFKNTSAVLFKGTPYLQKDVAEAIEGCDAVIDAQSNTSKPGNPWSRLVMPKDLLSISLGNVIREMRLHKISRLISLSRIGVGDSIKQISLVKRIVITLSNLKWLFKDHGDQESRLINSGLNWSVIRAPEQTDNNSDKSVFVEENKLKRISTKVSRLKVARFLIDAIDDSSLFNKTVAISS